MSVYIVTTIINILICAYYVLAGTYYSWAIIALPGTAVTDFHLDLYISKYYKKSKNSNSNFDEYI